jgi:hypothetical protein
MTHDAGIKFGNQGKEHVAFLAECVDEYRLCWSAECRHVDGANRGTFVRIFGSHHRC